MLSIHQQKAISIASHTYRLLNERCEEVLPNVNVIVMPYAIKFSNCPSADFSKSLLPWQASNQTEDYTKYDMCYLRYCLVA